MLPSETLNISIEIGIAAIMLGTVIRILRLLHKSNKARRKRVDLENNHDITTLEMVEPPPKKTATNLFEGTKKATRKILRPFKKDDTLKDFLSSLEMESTTNSSSYNINSTKKSSKSFNNKVKTTPRSFQLSWDSSRYDYKADTSKNSFDIKHEKMPSPPPSSYLKSQEDNINIDPMQISLLNELPSDTSPSFSKSPTQVPSRASWARTRTRSRSYSQHFKSQSNSSLSSLSSSRISSGTNSIQPIVKRETNDYTNFQPIQNFKPIKNPKGKAVVKKGQDDEMLYYARNNHARNNQTMEI